MGVACIADDILIYGVGDTKDAMQDHDRNVTSLALQREVHPAQQGESGPESGTTGFHEHQLTAQGLNPDPSKVEAILKLETLKTKEDIERLNGTVNYLAKFLPKLSQVMEPLRRLNTQKGVEWYWGDAKDKAFNEAAGHSSSNPGLLQSRQRAHYTG